MSNRDDGMLVSKQDFECARANFDVSKIVDADMHSLLNQIAVGGVMSYVNYLTEMSTTIAKVSTGIDELDSVLSGGYPVGITLIGGTPNVGKTTLAINSAIEMSKNKSPVVFLSYDMRKNALLDKIYSRISHDLSGDKGLTLQDISNKKLLNINEYNEKLHQAVISTMQYVHVIDMLRCEELQLYSAGEYDSVDADIEKIVQLFSMTYKQPVFIVDNIQLAAGFSGVDGKTGVDGVMRKMKHLSSNYKVPIILISTLSRSSYGKDLSLESYKESGNIEFDADSALVLQPQYITDKTNVSVDEFRAMDKREITIKSIKSRDSGFMQTTLTLNAPFCKYEKHMDDDLSMQQVDDSSKTKSQKSQNTQQNRVPERGDALRYVD